MSDDSYEYDNSFSDSEEEHEVVERDSRNYDLISDPSFMEDEYEPEQLVSLYRGAVRDLEAKVSTLSNRTDNSTAAAAQTQKAYKELSAQFSQMRQEHMELKNKYLQLKNDYEDQKKTMGDKLHQMTESYFSEVRSHQKTMNELYDLKHAPKVEFTLAKPVNIVAAVEVELRNGKITKMNLKESVDKARSDLIEELEGLKKTNDEYSLQIKNHDVVINDHKQIILQEQENVSELTHKVNELENIKQQQESTIQDKDLRIEELKAMLADLQMKMDGKLSDIDKKLHEREEKDNALIQTMKQEQMERDEQREREREQRERELMEKLEREREEREKAKEEETKNYEVVELSPEEERERRRKLLAEQKQKLGYKQHKKMVRKTDKPGDEFGLTEASVAGLDVQSSMMTSQLNPGKSQLKGSLKQSQRRYRTKTTQEMQAEHSKMEEKKEEHTSQSRQQSSALPVPKIKKRKINGDIAQISMLKPEMIDGGKQKTVQLGTQSEGLILIGDKNDEGKRFVLLDKATFKRMKEEDEAVTASLQTKHGFMATNGTIVRLYTMEGDVRKWEILEGVKNIGESEKGLLVVTTKNELYELTKKTTKTKIMNMPESPVGYIYMMKDMIFYQDKNNHLISYFVAMNLKCGNEIKCSMLRKVGFRLYSVKAKDPHYLEVYDERLQQTESVKFDEPIVDIVNYNIFALVATETKVYYLTRVKNIVLCVSDKKIKSVAFCGSDKNINVITCCEDNKVYKTKTLLKGHYFKQTSIKNVPCTVCKQINNEKMVFCSDCGMPIHQQCFEGFSGCMIHHHFPCIHTEK